MTVRTCLLLLASLASLTAWEIPLQLENPDALTGRQPLQVGIPFPRGMVNEPDQIGIMAGDQRLPAQIRVTNRWPQDGSIRWIFCDFQTELGPAMPPLRLRGDLEPLPPRPPLASIHDDEIRVDTGAAQFVIRKNGSNFLDAVILNGRTWPLTGSGPHFRDADGQRYAASLGPADSLELELNGPERAVLRAEGWFYNALQQPLCRYDLRTHFRRDTAAVTVYFTFIVTEDTTRARFNSISFSLPGHYRSAEFGGAPGNHDIGRFLLQYAYDRSLTGTSGIRPAWPAVPPLAAAAGWVSTPQLTLFVEDFAENFPHELEVTREALHYHFWPAHGISDPHFKVTDANRQYLGYCHQGERLDFQPPPAYFQAGDHYEARYVREGEIENCLGVAKTAVLRLAFALPAADIPAFTASRPLLMAAPEWMCGTGVFGLVHPYDPQRFPELEEKIARLDAIERRLQRQTPPGDFGKWNFGDAHTLWNDANGRWDDLYRTWKGYHHQSGTLPWLHYIRRGRPEHFRWAVAVSRHLMDIDICNWSNSRWEAPQPEKLTWARKIRGGLNDYKGLAHWHAGSRVLDYNAQTEFMLNYTFLTDDSRGLRVARMWGDAARTLLTSELASGKPKYCNREGAGSAAAFIDLYLATGETTYRDCAERLIDHIYTAFATTDNPLCAPPDSPFFRNFPLPPGTFTQWQNYAPFAEKYVQMSGDQRMRTLILQWAEAAMKARGDASSSHGADINVFAQAWFLQPDPSFLQTGAWLVENQFAGQLPDGRLQPNFGSLEYYVVIRTLAMMSALAAHDRPVSGLARGGSATTPFLHNTRIRSKAKFGTFTYQLQSRTGEPLAFRLKLGWQHLDTPLHITIQAPSGRLLHDEQRQLPDGYHELAFSLPATENGVYTCSVGDTVRFCAIDTSLPAIFPAGTLHTPTGGLQMFFPAPPDSTLKVTLPVPVTGLRSCFQIISPDGLTRHDVRYYPWLKKGPYTLEFTLPQAGFWSIRGVFESFVPEFSLNGKPITAFAAAPEKYFTP